MDLFDGDRKLAKPRFDLLYSADSQFTLALEQTGISSHSVKNPTNLWCCLDGAVLSRRRDASKREGETVLQFLERALPPDEFVFWPADRF